MTSDTPGGGGQSNQGWEELRRTAEEALQRPSARTAPVRTRATTWLILAFIIVSVIGLGTWTIVYLTVLVPRNGQRVRMRALEDRVAAYQAQVEYTNAHHEYPPGNPVQPLTDAEARELQELERRFGVAPTTKPAPAPLAPVTPAPAAPATGNLP